MQTIILQVKDSFMHELISFIDSAKDNLIIKKDKNLEQDPYFYERQAYLQNTINEIESGKIKTHDFDKSIDKLIEELES
jgi:ABC-type transporter lipoprotein component MlaA